MTKHLFKIIWNRRKKNLLMIISILLSFIILFMVFSIVLTAIKNYREPLGFRTENLQQLSIDYTKTLNSDNNSKYTIIKETIEQMRNIISEIDGVDSLTVSSNFLFNESFRKMQIKRGLFSIFFYTDDNYAQIMDLNVIEGRWYGKEDAGNSTKSVVITNSLRLKLFPTTPLDKITLYNGYTSLKVVGVVDSFRKDGNLSETTDMVFIRKTILDPGYIHPSFLGLCSNWVSNPKFNIFITIKTNGFEGKNFKKNLLEKLSKQAPDWEFFLDLLEEKRIDKIKQDIKLPGILLLISLFFLFNVAIGFFGIIWYNTGKRFPEIGLRRAMGSTAIDISYLIIGEALVLTTFSVILGTIFAVQVPLLKIFSFVSTGTYLLSWILAAVFVYFTAVLSAIYPAWYAAKKEPAIALHYE